MSSSENTPLIGDTLSGSPSTRNGFYSRFIERHQRLITALIMCTLSVVNVTDRYLVGSVLIDIQSFFNVDKSTAGLVQTVFLLSYMAFSPINGYLGDRINRKYMLVWSLLLWISSTLGGSFFNADQFAWFMASRCLFGVATASFEIIAVPILADRFCNHAKSRTTTLIVFSLGAPLGFAASYLISTIASELFPNDWRYTLRFTQFILAAMLMLVLFAYIEPTQNVSLNAPPSSPSSSSSSSSAPKAKSANNTHKSFGDDLMRLLQNKTLILLTFHFVFGLGSLSAFNWWSSSIIQYSLAHDGIDSGTIDTWKQIYSFSQAAAGAFGLLLPIRISSYFKNRTDKPVLNIDTYLLAIGFYANTFLLFVYLVMLDWSGVYLSFILYSLATVASNVSWVIVNFVFLDVVEPSLRSTANSLMICTIHLVGDSTSPYWIGLIADSCLDATSSASKDTYDTMLKCTQLSFYPLVFMSFAAGTCGLFMSLTFAIDKKRAAAATCVVVNQPIAAN